MISLHFSSSRGWFSRPGAWFFVVGEMKSYGVMNELYVTHVDDSPVSFSVVGQYNSVPVEER